MPAPNGSGGFNFCPDDRPTNCSFLCAGGENDDRGRVDIRRVLASIPHLLHSGVIRAADHRNQIHPGGVPGHLLARHVKLHVQSNHLLLDELPVRPTTNSIFC